MERYHCAYGLDSSKLGPLREHGMVFSGYDDAGEPRIAELPEHPFYLASLFQPELAGDGRRPHPFIQAFAHAVAGRGDQIAETGRGAIPAAR